MSDWVAKGVECQCVRDTTVNPWLLYLRFGFATPIPGPTFMEILTIVPLEFVADETEGHRVKLGFANHEYKYCVCGFVPLQKIEDGVEDTATAPVSKELADAPL